MRESQVSSSDAKIQVNFKTPTGTLINLYALDEPELEEHLATLGRQLRSIGEVEEMFGAMKNIFTGLTPTEKNEQAASQPAPAQGQAKPAPAQIGETPMCEHGQMVRKEGVRKSGRDAGKTVVDFHCPQPQGASDKCPSVWGKAS
jgi:hypothetical protein